MCKCDIYLLSPAGEMKTINLYSKKQPLREVTVGQLKKEAAQRFSKSGYFLGEIRLIVEGKPLDDDSASLSDCEVKPMSTVQMVTKVHGG